MNIQTFRYAASGGGNTLLGFLIYYISFKFIFGGQVFDFGFYAFKGHMAALFLSFCITFPVGFLMLKFVVFSDSQIRGRVQLFRYLIVCLFNLLLNYLLIKSTGGEIKCLCCLCTDINVVCCNPCQLFCPAKFFIQSFITGRI